MRKILLAMLLVVFHCPVALAGDSSDTGHWVALNEDYMLEIIMSHEQTLSLNEWDSQMIIRAKLAQIPRVVKALRFLVSEKSKQTIKAMKILGYTDTSTARLRYLAQEHLKQFEEIKKELEGALLPEEDDSDLVE